MHTWTIDSHPPLAIDPLIVQALRPHGDVLTGGGIALNLGIQADNGQVYRIARACDLAAHNRAALALTRLGLAPVAGPLQLADVSLEDVFAVLR